MLRQILCKKEQIGEDTSPITNVYKFVVKKTVKYQHRMRKMFNEGD